MHRHPVGVAETHTQGLGQFGDAGPDGVQAPGLGVFDGDAQADLARVVGLPVLEAPRVTPDLVAARRGPGRGVQVEERRLQLVQEFVLHMQETGAAGRAQVLAPGCGQHVAADAPDVDRELPNRLAGVQQEWHSGLPGYGANLLGWIDKPPLGRHVRHRDELRLASAVLDAVAKVSDGKLTVLVIVDDLDDGARPLGDLEESDHVARVLGMGGQNAVSRPERQRVECHVPRPGRVLHHRDLVRLAADQARDRRVYGLHLVVHGIGGLVPADLRFQPQVRDDRFGHDGGRQRRSRVVQVRHPCHSRGVTPGALNVKRPHTYPNRPGTRPESGDYPRRAP